MIRQHDARHLRLLATRFVRPRLAPIAAASALGLLAAALATVQPLVLAPIIDSATGRTVDPAESVGAITLNNVGATLLAWTGQGHGSWRVVVVATIAYLGLVALTSAIGFLSLRLISQVKIHLFRDLQETGYRQLLSLSMSYFVRQRTGELGSRLNDDALRAAQTVEPVVRGLLQGGFQLALAVLLLLRTDARLTGTVAVVFLVHLIITRLLRGRIRALVVGQSSLFAELANRIHETVLGIRIVKSFGAENFEVARFSDRARELSRVIGARSVYQEVEAPLREIVDAAGLIVVVLLAFSAFIDERLSISGLVLFVALTRKALAPASRLAGSILLLESALGSASRVLDVLDEKPEVADGHLDAPALRKGIRLSHVHFAYEGHAPVLHDVSFEIRRGEVVALVGPSGAGKSTLADLILRLYDPIRGEITWDGVPIRDFRQDNYRRHFGVVSQEALIFNASVAENIAYGRPTETAAVTLAARIAHADEFIRALPGGYQAIVGDRGIRLSGGQRQRLAIARALYGCPDLLVLDEATSALDAESEAMVQESLQGISRELTTLVIAHRLSTVMRAEWDPLESTCRHASLSIL